MASSKGHSFFGTWPSNMLEANIVVQAWGCWSFVRSGEAAMIPVTHWISPLQGCCSGLSLLNTAWRDFRHCPAGRPLPEQGLSSASEPSQEDVLPAREVKQLSSWNDLDNDVRLFMKSSRCYYCTLPKLSSPRFWKIKGLTKLKIFKHLSKSWAHWQREA